MTMRWGVVIVNYNTARFAIDAALSVIHQHPGTRVIIVDNASTNNAREIFEDSFRTGVHARHTPNAPNADLEPQFAELGDCRRALVEQGDSDGAKAPLTVLFNSENEGFAAGCNVGLRFLEETDPCSHYLLLNPDAIAAPGALAAFAVRLDEDGAGLCGATVLRANAGGRVQAFGGASLHPMTLMGANFGDGATMFEAPTQSEVEARLAYPLGAAIAFRADYLRRAGYLDERYFLYYEEADWTFAGRDFSHPVWAPNAVIFHYYGAASRSYFSDGGASKRSPLAEYHMARSRLLFALKWRPWLAPLMVAFGAGQVLLRVMRGRLAAAAALARGATPGAPRAFRP